MRSLTFEPDTEDPGEELQRHSELPDFIMAPEPQFPFFSELKTEIFTVFELLRLWVLRCNFWEWVLTYFEGRGRGLGRALFFCGERSACQSWARLSKHL